MKKYFLFALLYIPVAFSQSLSDKQLIDQFWLHFRQCKSGSVCTDPRIAENKKELEKRGWCYKPGYAPNASTPSTKAEWVKCTKEELAKRNERRAINARNNERIRNIHEYCSHLSFVYGKADQAKSLQESPKVALEWSKEANKIPLKTKKALINYVYFEETYHISMSQFERQCIHDAMRKRYEPLK